jgi:drug/metabolite transporter (DMT)-like permease
MIGSQSALAMLAIAISALMWGLWWLPLRMLEQAGLEGHWTTFTVYAGASVVLLPLLWRSRRARRGRLLPSLLVGALYGFILSFWSFALLMGEVVRVTLLFYLVPIWATGVAWAWFGVRPDAWRILAVIAGLAGAVVVLGFEGGFPQPRSLGDWAGLGCGVAFAFAAAVARKVGEDVGLESTLATFPVAAIFALPAIALIPEVGATSAPVLFTGDLSVPALVLAVAAIAVFWLLPQTWFFLWGAARLDPARVSILLMFELVSAAASASFLTDEPFGLREIAGCALIGTAALMEIRAESRAGL